MSHRAWSFLDGHGDAFRTGTGASVAGNAMASAVRQQALVAGASWPQMHRRPPNGKLFFFLNLRVFIKE